MTKQLFTALFYLLILSNVALAQSRPKTQLKIAVRDGNNAPLPFAAVYVMELKKGGLTDSLGQFSILLNRQQTYHVSVSSSGFQKQLLTLNPSGATVDKVIKMKPTQSQIGTVNISGETHGQILKTKPIKAQVINTLAVKERPTSLIELMNRTAGVRIRQSGALGSHSDVSLNGFQNRSIRYFKDGIPLNYLGIGFNLSLVPVNILDHVEVYQGVLPIYLGADALGGAINLVTRKETKSFAAFSYQYGSFNTHRASVDAAYISDNQKFFAGVNAFYNYSDGDYNVDVHTVDQEKGTLKPLQAKLFHNRFSNYYIETYTGFKNVSWADEFKIMLTGFALKKQFQFGSTMFKPFGAAYGTQSSIVPALKYEKRLFNNRLKVTEFAEINTLKAGIVDTLAGHYDWNGQFFPSQTEHGEISSGGSLSKIKYHYLTSNTNLNYKLSRTQNLAFNLVVNNYERKGSDAYGKKFPDGTDFLSKPAYYNKLAAAVGLTSDFWNKKIQNNLIAKFYRYKTMATDLTVVGDPETISNHNHQWGIADGVKFKISPHSLIQISAESAIRMPEQDEIFGDGNLKLANFKLKPERSLNLHLSFQTERYKKYHFETNVFFRNTKDMIILVPLYFLNFQSQNVNNVRGLGLDASGSYNIRPWLRVGGNFTYQDLRLIHTGVSTTEGARLRNTPYFFANLSLSAHFHSIVSENDRLEVYWFYAFVRQYYLDYIPKSAEPDGFLGLWGNAGIQADNIIPNQSLHTVGLTYYPFEKPLAIAFQVKNVFNAKIYDNFKIQNPGRNFSVKISYSL